MALRIPSNESEWAQPEANAVDVQTRKVIRVPLLIRAIDKAIFPKSSALVMTDSKAVQEIKQEMLAAVGKWAMGIICTLALGGFALGVWTTTRDLRLGQLEADVKRLKKMEILLVKLCQKNGIDTSRIEE